jgi:hypothetical protein
MSKDLEAADPEVLMQMVRIDDNIELVRQDLKEYQKAAKETIKDLVSQKKRLRSNLSQLPLFNEVTNDDAR